MLVVLFKSDLQQPQLIALEKPTSITDEHNIYIFFLNQQLHVLVLKEAIASLSKETCKGVI